LSVLLASSSGRFLLLAKFKWLNVPTKTANLRIACTPRVVLDVSK
jgi:hypothetical protein